MRIRLTLFLSAFMLVGCAAANSPPYQIDEQATAQAPWKVGDVIAQGEEGGFEVFSLPPCVIGYRAPCSPESDKPVREAPFYYRKFLGITSKGYYLVQDFYKNGDIKLTDPFMVLHRNDLGNMDIYDAPPPIDGVLTFWNANGTMIKQIFYREGLKHGTTTYWSFNGVKRLEIWYENDVEVKRQDLRPDPY